MAASLIADLLKKCDMPYALSVFLPECGAGEPLLSKTELLDVLRLGKDPHYSSFSKQESTPLLLDLVEAIRSTGSLRPNKVSSSCQTEDPMDEGASLEQKLRRIDASMHDRQEGERLVPFKTLEERMLRYKREVEQKAKDDLESEVKRLREFELSRLRIEEAQKYRAKV